MGLKRSLSKRSKKRKNNKNSKKRAKQIGGAPPPPDSNQPPVAPITSTEIIAEPTQKILDEGKGKYTVPTWVPQSEKPSGKQLNTAHPQLVKYLSTYESIGEKIYPFTNETNLELKTQDDGYGLFVKSAKGFVPNIDISSRLISIGGEYFNEHGQAIQKIDELKKQITSGTTSETQIPLNFYTAIDVILNVDNYKPTAEPFTIEFEKHDQGIIISKIGSLSKFFVLDINTNKQAAVGDLITEINGKFFNNHAEAIKEIEPFMKVLREKRELYNEIYGRPRTVGGSNDSNYEYSSEEEDSEMIGGTTDLTDAEAEALTALVDAEATAAADGPPPEPDAAEAEALTALVDAEARAAADGPPPDAAEAEALTALVDAEVAGAAADGPPPDAAEAETLAALVNAEVAGAAAAGPQPDAVGPPPDAAEAETLAALVNAEALVPTTAPSPVSPPQSRWAKYNAKLVKYNAKLAILPNIELKFKIIKANNIEKCNQIVTIEETLRDKKGFAANMNVFKKIGAQDYIEVTTKGKYPIYYLPIIESGGTIEDGKKPDGLQKMGINALEKMGIRNSKATKDVQQTQLEAGANIFKESIKETIKEYAESESKKPEDITTFFETFGISKKLSEKLLETQQKKNRFGFRTKNLTESDTLSPDKMIDSMHITNKEQIKKRTEELEMKEARERQKEVAEDFRINNNIASQKGGGLFSKKSDKENKDFEVTNFINYFIKITYELYEQVIRQQLPGEEDIQKKFMENYLKELYKKITPQFIELVIDKYGDFASISNLVTQTFEIKIKSQLDDAKLFDPNSTAGDGDKPGLNMSNVVFANAQEKYIRFLINSYTEHDYVKQRVGQTNGIRNIQKYLEDKFDEIFGIEQRNDRVENFKLEKVLNALFSNPVVRTEGFRSRIQKIDEAIDGFTNIRALQGIINDILGKENAISLTDGQICLGMQFPADKEDDQAEIDKLVKSVKLLSNESQGKVAAKITSLSSGASSQ